MDFTLPVAYNGLSINTSTRLAGGGAASGYRVRKFNPGVADVQQFLDSRGVNDGLDATDVYLGGRHPQLIVSPLGSSAADFYDRLRALEAAFSPTIAYAADSANLGFLALTFSQPTADTSSWTSGYIPMQMYCRPLGCYYNLDRDFVGGKSNKGIAAETTLPLLMRDPRKYAQTASSATISTATSTVTNLGNYPTAPTITIVSAATTGSLTFTIAGSSFTATIDATSTTYTINSTTKQFYKGATVSPSLITANLTYPMLVAGANTVIRGSLTGVTVTMAYRHAWA